ncbi:tRNA threonylcarbamoyl adenosine modification protein YeaZ [Spongiibacter sp. IMCC21906]|uniref:tRNA (adenosine(37)-N6)-threonylcarbamoyltransferase complex dimerization subunit type 1 TsaB n=1 Tax=Spongiibacter sp. IMCC21906 TaxID=1620392 RepID=UPI00062DF77A|nr:tRNA (adenosine(37)-N6)-threonylcarbamoyltransferase complex dimerization subunit type 1 TsaB [Spongiibacter sp. IMCC21906]AKH69521.1 tRNA threonylcarbamoyl adenosine modification protein YeaZ [Spongiibacter sp. IMCC21906]
MTSILAIDAATEACSVALLDGDKVREDFRMLPRTHTQFLLPMVDQQLRESGRRLHDLDAIAFTAGPGSFTGLRIACAVVQGLAYAADIPVIPISTLQAMGQLALQEDELEEGDEIYPVLDARMSEVYWGAYRVSNGLALAACHDQLSAPSELNFSLSNSEKSVGVGNGWQYRQAFSLDVLPVKVIEECYPRAAAMLPLAEKRFTDSDFVSAEQAQPVYLRDSVAWQKS